MPVPNVGASPAFSSALIKVEKRVGSARRVDMISVVAPAVGLGVGVVPAASEAAGVAVVLPAKVAVPDTGAVGLTTTVALAASVALGTGLATTVADAAAVAIVTAVAGAALVVVAAGCSVATLVAVGTAVGISARSAALDDGNTSSQIGSASSSTGVPSGVSRPSFVMT